jgi:predicted metallopeptidase
LEKEEYQRKKEEKEKDRLRRLNNKLDFAARPDTVVISRTTMDTNEMADLVGANDRLMNQLRRKIGFVKALTPTKFEELFIRSQEIKQTIHEFNKELARITGERYVAPRSYNTAGRQS